jgi:hypothetical protein
MRNRANASHVDRGTHGETFPRAHSGPLEGQVDRLQRRAASNPLDRLPLMNWLARLTGWLLGWLIPFFIVGVTFIGLFWLGALVLSLLSGKSVSDAFMSLLNSLLWN